MSPFMQSVAVLAVVLLVARFVKRGSKTLQRFFIPSALLAGLIGLLFGPQVFGTISSDVTGYWADWPKHLITVVFAGLFLGRTIPRWREVWRVSAPMIAFGNLLAWGQYALGLGLTMLVLTPVFGANPLAGTLIEISFEGGHGTAAGLAPTFDKVGWAEGKDVALALATLSLVMAIVIGLLFVNWHNRRTGMHHPTAAEELRQRRRMIRSGYNLVTLGRRLQAQPVGIIVNIAAFAVAIGLGWLMLQASIAVEDVILGSWTDIRLFPYLPLFPMAMLGGLMVQMGLRRLGYQHIIQRRTAEIICSIALDVLIATAVATVSLSAIGDNLPVFIGLGLAGIIWIVAVFWLLARRMFPTYWFENGLTNTGQSMGNTATGLLLGRLADPSNHSRARESFAYKQLVFEPFMGGGLVTASMLIFVYEFGSTVVLTIALAITWFWLVVGLHLGGRRT